MPELPWLQVPQAEAALRFASHAHRWQRRDHGLPYITHPINVATIVHAQMGQDAALPPEAIAIALLHDVLEDTETTYRELEEAFGSAVAEGVEVLSEPYWASRGQYYRRIMQAAPHIQVVKLSDRLDNIRDLPHCGSLYKLRKHVWETRQLFVPWAEALGSPLKGELEAALQTCEHLVLSGQFRDTWDW